MQQKRFAVLVIADNPSTVDSIRRCLENLYHVQSAASIDESHKKLNRRRYEFIFVDTPLLIAAIGKKPEAVDYKDALAKFRQEYPTASIVTLSSL